MTRHLKLIVLSIQDYRSHPALIFYEIGNGARLLGTGRKLVNPDKNSAYVNFYHRGLVNQVSSNCAE